MHRTVPLAAAALALAFAGCGGGDPEPPGDGAIAIPWLRAEPGRTPDVLRIGYESDPCTTARRARVEESSSTLTVTLLDVERDPDAACILLARPGCASVRLASALGGRRVVDGAPEAFPQRKRGADRLPFGRFGRCRSVPVER